MGNYINVNYCSAYGMGTSNIKDCFSKNKVESEKSITLQDFKDELYGNDTEDDNNN